MEAKSSQENGRKETPRGLCSKKVLCHLECPKNVEVTNYNSKTWQEGKECEMITKVTKEMTWLLN